LKVAILADTNPDYIRVYSPYNRTFIDFLKLNIPVKDRKPIRDENGKFDYWRIKRIWLGDIIKLLQDFFPNETIESDLVEEGSDFITAIFDACPEDKLDKLYRGLMNVFQPDVNPKGEEIAKRINAEYERRRSG